MSKDIDTSSESGQVNHTSQKHSGLGDNVSGDKYVLQAISPTELQTTIRKILTSLRYRQSIQAKEQLDTLNTTSNLNADATGILDIIKILVDITDDKIAPDAYQRTSTYISTTTYQLCRDI